MKSIFKFKLTILLCLMFLLFACEETSLINVDDNLLKEQNSFGEVADETFVTLDQATEFAKSFFCELTKKDVLTRQSINYSVKTLDENGYPLMYIINYSDGGFVIMGASKNYYPILAYSDRNSFDSTVKIGGLSDWMEKTKKAIRTSDVLADTIKLKMHNLWKQSNAFSHRELKKEQTRVSYTEAQLACWNRCDELQMKYGGEGWRFEPLSQTRMIFEEVGVPEMYDNLCFSANFNNSPIEASVVGWKDGSEQKKVGPLLSTKWHQHSPFNDLCNGKPAGCAAIALSQVMKYYEYPQAFTLDNYHFTWKNIQDDPLPGSDHAALVRLVGFFVDMNYSSSGSWTTPGNLQDGIESLGYNVSRKKHSYEDVEKELLNKRRPVIMVGNDDNIPLPSPLNYIGNSHYWVCDGAHQRITDRLLYFTEWQPNGNGNFVVGWNTIDSPGVLGGIHYLFFSMNWGWKGKNDGWFAFNNVNSGNGDFEHARQNFYITKP